MEMMTEKKDRPKRPGTRIHHPSASQREDSTKGPLFFIFCLVLAPIEIMLVWSKNCVLQTTTYFCQMMLDVLLSSTSHQPTFPDSERGSSFSRFLRVFGPFRPIRGQH
ncbi:hypothetical protein BO83DRAFT_382089 [Aspergillus eucalypticola CBS 122712]|uniref:Uncharacterized protein n=1 Tax=Aspergillus eucalypticola (strain CBS 122712 / IBT 29274) TaxID=1448314 RepID=A0A317UUD6_ASPEC|nr:uncharacterized protein BO83DRAFT_382089 [Aspergillus eucalypticola CBS 122712]PWY64122.1 hypothetical protein BO83DRAFT_382089 [Aspergillus eucalypticola CBS 122712]